MVFSESLQIGLDGRLTLYRNKFRNDLINTVVPKIRFYDSALKELPGSGEKIISKEELYIYWGKFFGKFILLIERYFSSKNLVIPCVGFLNAPDSQPDIIERDLKN